MFNLSFIILDLIVVGIIVLMVILSAKRGFVRTVVEVVGFVLAIMVAISLGSGVAGMIYDNTVGPNIVSVADNTIDNTAQEIIDDAWDALPDFVVKNAEAFGISKEKINESLADIGGENKQDAVEQAINNSIRPIFVRIVGMLCSFILFIILSFVVKLLAKLLNGIFSFSIAGDINRTLGGIAGLFKGVVFAVIFCVVIGMLVSFTGGFWIFTHEALEASIITKFLLSITPFALV